MQENWLGILVFVIFIVFIITLTKYLLPILLIFLAFIVIRSLFFNKKPKNDTSYRKDPYEDYSSNQRTSPKNNPDIIDVEFTEREIDDHEN